MKTSMLALALALVAPAAFSQASAPTTQAPAHAKPRAKKPAPNPSAQGNIKVLRGEIKTEKGELSAKAKAAKSEHAALVGQERGELGKVKTVLGNKSEHKAARLAVRQKYARLFQDAHEKRKAERRMLREDIKAKRALISKLRQS